MRRVFVYGSNGQTPDDVLRDGVAYRILADHLGGPVLVVDTATGAIVQQNRYDSFGRAQIQVMGSDWQPLPIGFAGGLTDADTGLVRFGARDYDPEVGRWTAKDPIRFGGGDTKLIG